ncbi:phosphate ABC transporter ATP-binding protein [Limosilactobacillus fermentum]
MEENIALELKDVSVAYGAEPTVHNVSMKFKKNQVSALIGASGSGKSTLLRSINRMNDGIANVTGQILFHDVDINQPKVNVYKVRQEIGMVFQQPTPFPMSIYENVIYGLRLTGEKDRQVLDQRVEESLKQAALWEEVKDRLKVSALSLSGGDEPTSALDPISTTQIEATMMDLKKNYTIIIVTHNMQQASRASDWTAFMHQGKLIEFNQTTEIFMNPHEQATNDYLNGKFG